jgi:hypothetical protein
MGEQVVAVLVAAFVSALVSLAVAVVQLRQRKASQRIQIQQEINAKYDKMVDYRLQHPDVLSLSRRWRPDCFTRIYDQKTEDDRSWAIYYGYVELIISYCHSVLYAMDGTERLIDPDFYRTEHEPLIRLLLAEHYPILAQIARPGAYVSKYLVNHIQHLKAAGWNWEASHADLVKPGSAVIPATILPEASGSKPAGADECGRSIPSAPGEAAPLR